MGKGEDNLLLKACESGRLEAAKKALDQVGTGLVSSCVSVAYVTIVLLCHVEHMPSSNVASVKVTSPIPRSFNEAEYMMRRSTTNPRLWGANFNVQIPRSSSFFEYKYIVSSSDAVPTIWKENRDARSISLLIIPQNQGRIEVHDYFQFPVRGTAAIQRNTAPAPGIESP